MGCMDDGMDVIILQIYVTLILYRLQSGWIVLELVVLSATLLTNAVDNELYNSYYFIK